MSAVAAGIAGLSGLLAYAVVAALVFGETALFLGFVLPGETAVVLGGVLASRGRVSLPPLMLVVVVAAVVGPLVGYEIGRRMGARVIASPRLRRMSGVVDRALAALNSRAGAAVVVGRFTAVLRALMPALAGTAGMRYRTFAVYNALSGVVWGVGYSLLGYLAGSAYTVIEREVGAGVAIAIAAAVAAAVAAWAVRRHRRGGGALARRLETAAVAGGPVVGGPVVGGPAVGGPGADGAAMPGAAQGAGRRDYQGETPVPGESHAPTGEESSI